MKDLLLIFNMKRSTYYAAMQNKADKYESEKELIKQVFHHHKGRYGYRRITQAVRRAGFILNHKTVKRLMDELGLKSCVRPKKYHSYKGIEGKSFPNILQRNFKACGFTLADNVRVEIFHNGVKVYSSLINYGKSFADVEIGEPVIYMNSAYHMAVAINQESFAEVYHIGVGKDWKITMTKE